MVRMVRRWLIALAWMARAWIAPALVMPAIACLAVAPAAAEDVAQQAVGSSTPVRVATFLLPPYVMTRGDTITGFSVDLWRAIAGRLKLASSVEMEPDVNALMQAVQTGKADIGISGVFITAERDRDADFSVPILNAGLQVMVPDAGGPVTPRPLQALFELLFSPTAAIWLGVALLIVLVPSHLLWWFDRGKEDGVSPERRYFPGIFSAMFWTASALVSQAQQMPRHWAARLIAVIWMFVAVVFIALYTAQLTASLTAQRIRGAINGAQDLPGKQVGTITGSTSTAYLRSINAEVVEFQHAEDMYRALEDGKLDAVLFSSPTLRYYILHEGAGRVRLVGPEFRQSDLGIVFPLNSELRKKVDIALLSLREDGTYLKIYAKWFGDEASEK